MRVAAATGAVRGAASLCGLLPLQTKLGRSVCNFQSHHRIFMRKAAIRAGGPGGNQSGSGEPSRVDTEMIVLRKLMQELRMHETTYAPPRHWMKWEKEWSVTYVSDHMCQFLQCLQSMLINRRPAIAIASLALILPSVPAFLLLLLNKVSQISAPQVALAMEFLTKLLDVQS